MLARLQDVAGVSDAAVDYGGQHLRLTLDESRGLRPAVTLLAELGYEPAVVAADDATASTWYDIGSVGELSTIEAA